MPTRRHINLAVMNRQSQAAAIQPLPPQFQTWQNIGDPLLQPFYLCCTFFPVLVGRIRKFFSRLLAFLQNLARFGAQQQRIPSIVSGRVVATTTYSGSPDFGSMTG